MWEHTAGHMSVVDGMSLGTTTRAFFFSLFSSPTEAIFPFTEYEDSETQKQFDEFYEDIYTELTRFGEIEELNVCENLGDHLIGNVYIKYKNEDDAYKAALNLTGRYYGGL
jgi:hypothetical protein